MLYPHSQRGGYVAITLSVRPLVCPSVHTFVTDISASTGRNDFIFDIWLLHGDLYRVSPFQVYRTSTSCLLCDLQMNEWGYSQHDVACNILLIQHKDNHISCSHHDIAEKLLKNNRSFKFASNLSNMLKGMQKTAVYSVFMTCVLKSMLYFRNYSPC